MNISVISTVFNLSGFFFFNAHFHFLKKGKSYKLLVTKDQGGKHKEFCYCTGS